MKNKYLTEFYNQILNFNKPVGWTSFDVVKKVRVLTGIKKVGHAGTLDPFASGVLLICTGPATKKMNEILQYPKTYEGTVHLGEETDTLDSTGTVILKKEIPSFSERDIQDIFQKFLGEIEQEIPPYSAAKHKGKRLYKLARKGLEIPRLTKKVIIYELELLNYSRQEIAFRVKCSSGTYIRVLARDVAKELGTTGYLTQLTRTEIGPYRIEDAWSIEKFQKYVQAVREKVREHHEDLP